MTHANKVCIKSSAANLINSQYLLGDAPATSGSSLAISGTVAHNNIITIVNDGTLDFGDKGADFLFQLKLENSTAGGSFELVEGSTFERGYVCSNVPAYTNLPNKLPVKTLTGMPYNKAWAVGDLQANRACAISGGVADYGTGGSTPAINPKLRAIASRPSKRSFTFFYCVWPADEQLNCMVNSCQNEQVKLVWNYGGVNGSGGGSTAGANDLINGWVGPYSGSANSSGIGEMTAHTRTFMANELAFVADPSNQYKMSYSGADPITIDSTHQVSNILCYQDMIVSDTPNNSVYTRCLDTVNGEIYKYTETHPRQPTIVVDKFDRCDFPGNIQGHNTEWMVGNPVVGKGKNQFVSSLYQAYGDNAACRVEIADVADPTVASTSSMKRISVCIPVYWSKRILKVKVIEGLFWNAPLSGYWLHVYDKNNTFLGSVQIP